MSASTDLLFGPDSRFETLYVAEQARRLETDDMSEWIRESAEQYVSAESDFRRQWEMAWLHEAERRIARAEARGEPTITLAAAYEAVNAAIRRVPMTDAFQAETPDDFLLELDYEDARLPMIPEWDEAWVEECRRRRAGFEASGEELIDGETALVELYEDMLADDRRREAQAKAGLAVRRRV